jgi:hypothetical protein
MVGEKERERIDEEMKSFDICMCTYISPEDAVLRD